jgi:hypothetical protein
MVQIGDKAGVFLNTEDIMTLIILKVVDVYEISLQETYAQIEEKMLSLNLKFGEQMEAKFGEGSFPIRFY